MSKEGRTLLLSQKRVSFPYFTSRLSTKVKLRRKEHARRLCCGCGRCALVTSFPGVRVWSHAFDSVALRAVWCCVCYFVSAAPVRVGCFLSLLAAWGLVCVLPFLRCWSALVGRLSVLECAFWGFLLSFVLLHLFPLLRLFVTQSEKGMNAITRHAASP